MRLALLDTTAAEPLTALAIGSISPSHATLALAHPEDANQGRHEPKKCRKECKGNVSLESAALVAAGSYVGPVEDATAVAANKLIVVRGSG